MVLTGGALPVIAPVVAVMTCTCRATVLVVKVIVAAPLPLVVLVCDANVPPLVLDHVTVTPGVVTGLPPASNSCAVTVTFVPATTEALLVVTP